MEDSTVFEAIYKIKFDQSNLSSDIKNVKKTVEGNLSNIGVKSTKSLSDKLSEVASQMTAVFGTNAVFQGFKSGIADTISAFNQYEAALNGVKAVSSATGNDIAESMAVIKDSTVSGLLTQSDTAAAVKNLELYGFTAAQSAEMINVLTDAASYNRQANYSVSEAVRVTTEGIRMENSVLSDAAGVTTNIAKMYENYADSIDKSSQELTKAEKVQAVYNGVMNEASVFSGNAEQYSDSLAGSQSRLSASLRETEQTLGAVFSQFSPIISGLADFISHNQQLVASASATIAILAVGGGLIGGFLTLRKILSLASQAMTTFGIVSKAAQGGLIGLGVAVAAVGGALIAANGFNKMLEVSDNIDKVGDNSISTSQDLGQLKKAMDDTAKKAAELNQQMFKLNRDYARDLKQIAVKHQENLDDLTQQIEEANIDYRRAIDERMADFNVTLAKQERSHQETVNELMTQLAFLQRYNNDYNKQKLAQVQFALAKEQELYRRETETQRAEIELQNQADRQKLESKLASLQQEQADEIAFMNKHRDDLNAVRDVILLDEIESLKERYFEQKSSLDQQIAENAVKGVEAARAYYAAYDEIAKAEQERLRKNLQTALSFLFTSEGKFNFVANAQWKEMDTNQRLDAIRRQSLSTPNNRPSNGRQQSAILSDSWSSITTKVQYGYSSGGYTGPGPKNEVAGIVHRGEYVIPQEGVDQSTGLPKILSPVQNVYINISGTFATSAAERRRVALEVKRALADVDQARLTSEQARVVI